MPAQHDRKPAAKKPARKRVSAAERKRREAQAAAEQPAKSQLENGVIVWRVEDEANPGQYQFVVQCIGDVKPTEITDTLAYGIKVNKEQRGIDF